MADTRETTLPGGTFSYIRSLDGLRGVAILGVFLEHFPPHYRLMDVSPGGAGVSLFFVLSGYLITRILLNYDKYNIPIGRKAYHFCARRFLRLSPAYFVAIAIAYVLDIQGMREFASVHVLYMTNMMLAWRGEWLPGGNHFWSLCVEEQFYLIWFFLVVLLTGRSLIVAIVVAIAMTLVTRSMILALGVSPLTSVILPGQSAVLAVGALLALAEREPLARNLARPFDNLWVLVAAAAAFTLVSLRLDVMTVRVLVYPFAAALVFGCLIRRAVSGRLGWLEPALCTPLLVWIGRISYGLFVYHAFLPDIIYKVAPAARGWLMDSLAGLTLLWSLSFFVAWVSWHLLEQPCLRLKERVRLFGSQMAVTRA